MSLCEEHGHDCPTCTTIEFEKQDVKRVAKQVSNWNWNYTPREAAIDIEESDVPTSVWFDEMRRFGFRQQDIESVKDILI